VRDAFGLDVPLVAIFEHTTLGAFAAHLDRLAAGAGSGAALPTIPRLRRQPGPKSV
jgi:hypothetical protein